MANVYVVTQNDYEWTNLVSAWSSEEAAKAECARLLAADTTLPPYGWFVEALEIDEPYGNA